MIPDQRQQGRRVILKEIRRAGRIARVDLATRTGISQATVTTITAELIRDGLIEETSPKPDNSESRRGRPRVALKMRGAARILAGIKLADRAISVVVVDFEGTLIAKHAVPFRPAPRRATDLVPMISDALGDACKLAGVSVADLSGVGIGLAGTVDAENGQVHWSPSFTDRNLAFQAMVGRALGIPVFIDNDANLIALAEKHFGRGRGVKDFIVVTIENGVGMGLVLNDVLYRGTRGCGTEFGHTKVQLDGALCRCGQRGCLEAYVADYALLREAAISLDFSQDGGAGDKVEALIRRAKEGDATAKTILSRAGRMFAMGLANLVNIFDPELIILSGERMQFDHLYAADVIEQIKAQIVQIDMAPPEVIIHRWGDLMWAKGAAAFAIEGVTDLALESLGEHAV